MKKICQLKTEFSTLFRFNSRIKLTLTLLLFSFFGIHAHSSISSEVLSLGSIGSETDCSFMSKTRDIDIKRIIKFNINNKEIFPVFEKPFNSSNVGSVLTNNRFFLEEREKSTFINTNHNFKSKAQDLIKVTGTVTDEEGTLLPGVNVSIKGTSKGTSTDFDGNYEIEVEQGQKLKFSSVGFKDQTKVIDDENTIDIIMEEGTALDEVVIVGYGTQKKKNLTGAVDAVNSDVFENRSTSSVGQALDGVVPNLNISIGDGKPGQTASFNIRGQTSIGQGGSALVLIDGVEGDASFLNPNDIKEVTVLKDASSAAIYGARAAFGVVLITTKDPDKNKTKISYTGNFSFQSLAKNPEYVTDGVTWLEHFRQAYVNESGTVPTSINNNTQAYSDDYLERMRQWKESGEGPKTEVLSNGDYEYYDNFNWMGELFKNHTLVEDHNITISGGNDKADFYLTGRIYDFDGLYSFDNDNYRSYNIRTKGSLQVTDWLKATNNFTYSRNKYHQPFSAQGKSANINRYIQVNAFPTQPMYNPDGTFTRSGAATLGAFEEGNNFMNTAKNQFRNTTGLSSNFFDDHLSINADFTFRYDDHDQFWKRTKVPYYTNSNQEEPSYMGEVNGVVKEDRNRTLYTASNIYAEYQNSINDEHNFKGLVGWNYETSKFDATSIQRDQLLFDEGQDINLATGENIQIGSNVRKWKTAGAFFRINYNYDGRYLLEINGRYDGSSRFPSGQQWKFFPSVSGGWELTNEPYWNLDKNLLSNFKLRASYGSLGNGNISPYQFEELLSVGTSGRVLDGRLPARTSAAAPIPSGLTWEKVTTSNFGLDFSLLNGQLNFNGDFYIRETTDMYVHGPTLPDIYGAGAPKGNYADMTTKGYELTLVWKDQFDIGSKPFNYQIKGTLADNKSKIDKFNNPNKKLNDHYKGETLGEIWGFKTDGLFQENPDSEEYKNNLFKSSKDGKWRAGDLKIQNLDGSSDNRITQGEQTVDDPGDMAVIGNTEPRYIYSFTINLEWNNIFLSAFFKGVGSQNWDPGKETAFWGQYNRGYNQMPKWHQGNYWTEDNRDAYLPRYSQYNGALGYTNSIPNDRYLQKVSYLRLRNIQIGYTLPDSWVSKTPLENVQIFLTGENLFSWSPVYKYAKNFMDVSDLQGNTDPDLNRSYNQGAGNNYPLLKTITFGITITY